jgi:hypothetical protein
MATIVPKLDRMGNFRDLYTLSIVLFNRRDPLMEMNAVNERLARVAQAADFYSGGYGGGDLKLTAARESDLDLREGSWVMLGGSVSGSDGNPIFVFQWYRVLAADMETHFDDLGNADASDDVWTREVTIHGPDWHFGRTPQVTLVSGVVAVYEKTIRLETSSLWSDL